MDIKEKLGQIVGKDNILDSAEMIKGYGRDYSVESLGLFTCVVRPQTVDQTQKVIQLANEDKFPIVPQSSKVHFNGGAIPRQGGVVVDLSGMNKIVEINEESKVAHLQVGVTWGQFQAALESKGYRALIPLLPHTSRSVIMDWLEREQPVVQNYEYADPLMSMEVIWGNGEHFVTGSAGIGGFRTEGVIADGVIPAGPGPMSYDTFLYGSQGTMGVVTWGAVVFEEIPTLNKTFFIPADRVEAIIEPLYQILRRGICYECMLVNNIDLATILTESWPEQFNRLRAILPAWTLVLICSALHRRPEEKIAYQEKFLREVISTYYRNLKVLTTLPGLDAIEKKLPDMLRKPWPKNRTFWKHTYKGGCQDLMFMTTLERVDRYIPVVAEVAAKYQYPTNEIGCYIQPVQDGHACQVQFNFYYDPENDREKSRIKNLYKDAGAALLGKEAYFNRPYGVISDMVYKKHGDYALLLKRFKKHFDPVGILNPGKLCF